MPCKSILVTLRVNEVDSGLEGIITNIATEEKVLSLR